MKLLMKKSILQFVQWKSYNFQIQLSHQHNYMKYKPNISKSRISAITPSITYRITHVPAHPRKITRRKNASPWRCSLEFVSGMRRRHRTRRGPHARAVRPSMAPRITRHQAVIPGVAGTEGGRAAFAGSAVTVPIHSAIIARHFINFNFLLNFSRANLYIRRKKRRY